MKLRTKISWSLLIAALKRKLCLHAFLLFQLSQRSDCTALRQHSLSEAGDIHTISAIYFTRAMHASMGINCCQCRVSVCLSVHLKHAGIVSKRLNIESRKRHTIAQELVF